VTQIAVSTTKLQTRFLQGKETITN